MIENLLSLMPVIRSALDEDLGPGDITTNAIIDSEITGLAVLIAREELVLAGLPVFETVFLEISPRMEFERYFQEGDIVPAGARVCSITGPLSHILKAERTALNFLQRMSGIATLTRQYVEKVRPYKAMILDTRKTAPGIRSFDKYAVRTGGGLNHRFGLFDGVLIKDNHIVAAGSISRAIQLAKKGVPHTLKIEVEVEDMAGVEEALQAGADVILLDNMPPEQMTRAVQLASGRVMIEASGGISLDTVTGVAKCGVDLISVGALTHSPRAADFSLEILSKNNEVPPGSA
ncbi:MAG: carboxylating nicotinate-nucleotide diphosphorylase [Thermodesulfobacteriota bacterium]|nr:carboxylating nicotinate-nucleotide diphosphorylase [Thermodesulfobacteriota bacterium]